MNCCLYTGWVRHRRHHPRVHDFRYRLFLAYLDLDELDRIGRAVRPFSVNRWNLWSFFDRDHIDGRPGSTAGKVRRLLAQHGIALDGGAIRLPTRCRVLGYLFNPISLYYCHERGGALAAVVAEVSNTFRRTAPPRARRTALGTAGAADDPHAHRRAELRPRLIE